MRVSIAASLATGRAQRARVTIPDLRVAGLHLAVVDVHAQQLQLVARWPPRLRAERIVVRVRVEQDALDRWTRSNALPVRLALRAGVIIARTGIAGRRFGELEVAVGLDRGRVRLNPRRMSMLGVALTAATAAMPPVTLPLPPLPRHATLLAVEPAEGAIELTFELANLDEPLTADRLRSLTRALRGHTDPAASPPRAPARPHHQPGAVARWV